MEILQEIEVFTESKKHSPYHFKAFLLADSFDIKAYANTLASGIISLNTSELFFKIGNFQFVYCSSYGVAVFFNTGSSTEQKYISSLKPFESNPLVLSKTDTYEVRKSNSKDTFTPFFATLHQLDEEVVKIICTNIGKSIALENYQEQATQLLEDTNCYTKVLGKKGKLQIKPKTLLKFIGKTMTMKSNIFDELYIFDQPTKLGEGEYLDKIEVEFNKIFDIKNRYLKLTQNLKIVTENLELFKDLVQHEKSQFLEIIIIALIFVEVCNMFIEKLL